MPKSKSKQRQNNNKQKKLITARLMQISFKIDDYVYNNKPITEDEAKLYMREVEAYKVNCYKDERSLQVIEKLTRYMNAIISEHEAKNVSSENQGSVSPVYSICDEDLTQFTQTEEPNNGANAVNDFDCNNIENRNDNVTSIIIVNPDCMPNVEVEIHKAISNLSLKDNEELITTTTANEDCSPTILDPYNNNKDHNDKLLNVISNKTNISDRNTQAFFNKPLKVTNPIITSKLTVVEASDIKNTLPYDETPNTNSIPSMNNMRIDNPRNMTQTLQQTLIPHKFNTTSVTTEANTNSSRDLVKNVNNNLEKELPTVDCSQSILKDYKDKVTYANKNPAISKDANMYIGKPDPIIITANNQNRKQATLSTNHNANLTATSNLVTVTATHAINTFQNYNLLQKPIQLNKELPRRVNTEFFKLGDNKNSQKLTHQGKIPSTKVTFNNLAPLEPKTTINTNHNSLNKKKRAPRKKKLDNMLNVKNQSFNPNPIDSNNEQTVNVKRRKKAKIVPIYNKAVENDLSWLEGIRYVREVKDDEIVTLQELKDTFWENYSLPADWNESEYFS